MDYWRFRSDTGSTRSRITSSGYVGFATASPSPYFSVDSDALFATFPPGLLFSYSNANSSGIIDTGHSSTALEFRVGNTQELLINGSSATFASDVYVTGTTNSNVVISRDNMYLDAGQFYIGADDSVTDDSFRQRTASGSYFIESRKSGTWTNRLQINSAGTLIIGQGATFAGKITAQEGIEITGGSIAQSTAVLHTNNIIYFRGGSNGLFLQNADGSDGYYISNSDHKWEVNSGESMRLTSTGLGIGTSSPSVKLDTRLSSTTGKVAEFHNSVGYGIGFTVESDGGINTINSESNQALAFATNGASNERIRITSGGDVLMGNTVVNPASGFASQRGFGYDNSTGNLQVASTSGTAMTIGRNESSDGQILELRKESNIKHSFGSTSSYLLGNVGIGLTNPAVKFEIQDSTHTTMKIRSGNNDNILFAQALQSDEARIGTDTNSAISFFTNKIQAANISSISKPKNTFCPLFQRVAFLFGVIGV